MRDQLENMDYKRVLGDLNAEPKRTYLWVAVIDGVDAVLLRKFARPTLNFAEEKIPYLNTYRFYSGKAEWQPIEIESNDPIVPSARQKWMQWVRLQYETATGRRGYAAVYKKDIQIKMLGPAGTTVELWDLKGTKLNNINFHELDYRNESEVAIITATLRFDAAILRF